MHSGQFLRSIIPAKQNLPCLCLAAAYLVMPAVASARIPATERAALDALYQATGGPWWTDHEYWGGLPGVECYWTGVTCDETGDHVVELRLPDNNLRGALPDRLRDLTRLQVLDLSGNRLLSSGIPVVLGDLGELEILDLNGTYIHGEIPPRLALLAKLRRLDLSQCDLEGSIPPDLGYLPSLQFLSLADNELSGPIPPEIGRLTELLELHLEQNRLTGPMPDALGRLSRLEVLALSRNRFEGPIPSWLGDLDSLKILDLRLSGVTGPVPEQIGRLLNLVSLDLSQNALGGTLPENLANLTALQVLRVSSAEIGGSIPASLGRLSRLESVELEDNRLIGPIPDTLSGLEQLRILRLGHNRLSGPVPPWLGGLSNITELNLEANRFSGPLPEELTHLVRLRTLLLEANRLAGELPAGLGTLRELDDLSLKWNALWTNDAGLRGWLADRERREYLRNLVTSEWSQAQALPPEDLEIEAVSPLSVKLRWRSRPRVEGLILDGESAPLPVRYQVLVATAPDGPFVPMVTPADGLDLTSDGTAIAPLEPDTTYYIRVRGLAWPHSGNANVVLGPESETLVVRTPEATTWYVAPGGDDSRRCDSPDRPCATLPGAASLASDGDRVRFSVGDWRPKGWMQDVYWEAISRSLALEGNSTSQTLLPDLTVGGDVVVVLSDLSIEGLASYSSQVFLRDVDITGTRDLKLDGGVLVAERILSRAKLEMTTEARAVFASSTLSPRIEPQNFQIQGGITFLWSTAWGPAVHSSYFPFTQPGHIEYRGSVIAFTNPTCSDPLLQASGVRFTFTLGGNVLQGEGCRRDEALNDVLVDDVGLGPLAPNGGTVMTHLPRSDSPAIDRVECTAAPRRDACGAFRPTAGACDAGACELPAPGDSGTAPRRPDPRRH